jgi:hypothetical protein
MIGSAVGDSDMTSVAIPDCATASDGSIVPASMA